KRGVYPRNDRSSLLMLGGHTPGGLLPFNEWATEFADKMPGEILSALRAARHGSSGRLTDADWREKLAERFGSRWRVSRLRLKDGGSIALQESPEGIPLLPKVRPRKKKEQTELPFREVNGQKGERA